jgi:hypothetical protein
MSFDCDNTDLRHDETQDFLNNITTAFERAGGPRPAMGGGPPPGYGGGGRETDVPHSRKRAKDDLMYSLSIF